ncbi:MAG TPA: disulfide bond formation protein B [Caulobacter sp.]|nr:disulfide bond formation protein B [Caulobacter sp.]
MTRLFDFFLSRWRTTAFLSSALMLAIAHGFEKIGGLAPCYLCLKQREVYWVALTAALVGMILVRTRYGERFRRPANALLGVIFLVGVGVAVYHAGAEWGWWPGPTICASGGSSVNAADMAAIMKGEGRIAPPSCEKAVWVFLGLSMAGWNALISLKLAVLSFLATRKVWA